MGRTDRMVNKLDVVTDLPPLDDYAPTPYGRWVPYNQSATNATMVQVRRCISFLPSAVAACLGATMYVREVSRSLLFHC